MTWILGTTASLLVIIGLGVKFVLLPYLRDHLINPIRLVEKQVSENHHSNAKPTLLDSLDDVKTQVQAFREEMQREIKDVRSNYDVIARMYEGHMDWSDRWVNLIEGELDLLKRVDKGKTDT